MASTFPLPPRSSAGAAPPRAAASVRRTSSIDVSWPQGRDAPARIDGRARDIVTPAAGGMPTVVAAARIAATLARDRTILAIDADPPRPALARLIGERGGGGLRKLLRETVPEELAGGAPLYLLLDDLSGASLVSGWAWSQWNPDWLTTRPTAHPALTAAFPDRTGICSGFAPGSSAFDDRTDRSGTTVPDLVDPADPDGWHAMPGGEGARFRRARRIDIRADDMIRIDSAFQDSATTPAGGRAAVHEYRLTATIDPATMTLAAFAADPRILPFVECPAAAGNIGRLIGTPLADLRAAVLAMLRGTAGCTHLNDALRALADVPALSRHLPHGQPAMPLPA